MGTIEKLVKLVKKKKIQGEGICYKYINGNSELHKV